MDAGVVSDFRPQAFASRTAAENFKSGGLAPVGPVETSRLPVATRPPQPKVARAVCGGAAPLRCAEASPSSRLLASDPTALATPRHTLFQQPARVLTVAIGETMPSKKSGGEKSVRKGDFLSDVEE